MFIKLHIKQKIVKFQIKISISILILIRYKKIYLEQKLSTFFFYNLLDIVIIFNSYNFYPKLLYYNTIRGVETYSRILKRNEFEKLLARYISLDLYTPL